MAEDAKAARRLDGVTISILVFVGLALLLDVRVIARGNLEPVSAATMAEAKAAIAATRRSGDLVVHSPLLSMAELTPLGDMLASPALPVAALRKSRRVLLLDRAEQPMYGFGTPASVQAIGALELKIYEPSGDADTTVFDMHTDLAQAQMRVERGGQITSTCTQQRAEGGRSCPGEPDWLYIGRRELVIGGATTPCVWAHPTTNGAIVFELPAMTAPPAGRQLRLTVSAGLTDDAVRGTPGGSAVQTDVLQGDAKLAVVQVPNKVGWVEREVVIAANAPVTLRVTTPKDGRRHHCINARIEEAAE